MDSFSTPTFGHQQSVTLLYYTLLYSTLLYYTLLLYSIIVKYASGANMYADSAVQSYSAVKHWPVKCSAVQCSAVQCTAVSGSNDYLCSLSGPHLCQLGSWTNIALHCTTMHSTAQNYPTMHCTALHCNTVHSTALHHTEHSVPSFWDSFTFVRLVSPVQRDRITAAAGTNMDLENCHIYNWILPF